jgi:phosphomethylpyrimidine synthase
MDSFNGGLSRKVEVGDLRVPFRDIPLTTGGNFRQYDTSGPQGFSAEAGLPKRRAEWVAPRIARGDAAPTQLFYARQGLVTEEMRFVAIREGVDPSLSGAKSRLAGPSSPPTSATSRSSR